MNNDFEFGLTACEKGVLAVLKLNIDQLKEMAKTYPVIFEHTCHHSVFANEAQIDAMIAKMEAAA